MRHHENASDRAGEVPALLNPVPLHYERIYNGCGCDTWLKWRREVTLG